MTKLASIVKLPPVDIRTPRLLLRTPVLQDSARISLLAGDYDVASMTGTIPHPYSEDMAAAWIASVIDGEEGVVFAILRADLLIGCIGYRAFGEDHAELGYWIGKPYWGQGYASEAVAAVWQLATDLQIRRLYALCHPQNRPSARVLQKTGFEFEGILRQHMMFPNLDPAVPHDVECWSQVS